MPVRAPRICGCGHKIASGERCACERKRKAEADARRPGAARRGYDSGWTREAKAFLALPGNDRCECGAPATLVRHVISIRLRPDLRMLRSNWKPGCVRCNARDAARDRREASR